MEEKLKEVKKEDCVACKKTFFVGDVLEVLDHLCNKHRNEYIKKMASEIEEFHNMAEDIKKK